MSSQARCRACGAPFRLPPGAPPRGRVRCHACGRLLSYTVLAPGSDPRPTEVHVPAGEEGEEADTDVVVEAPEVAAAAGPAAPVGSRRVAISALAIVLGFTGIHHFLLGRWGHGTAALLLTLVGCGFVPWGLGVYDGVRYLTMSDEQFGRRAARGAEGHHVLVTAAAFTFALVVAAGLLLHRALR